MHVKYLVYICFILIKQKKHIMKNLLELLERVSDEKGIGYLCKLAEKHGYNRDIIYFPHLIDDKDIEGLENILTECLTELPF